jgi:hypothetical protein
LVSFTIACHWSRFCDFRLHFGVSVRVQSLKASQHFKPWTKWGWQSYAQSPIWRTRVSPFVWIITFDLSDVGHHTSRYATAGIALRIIWPRKSHLHVKAVTSAGRKMKLAIEIKNQTTREGNWVLLYRANYNLPYTDKLRNGSRNFLLKSNSVSAR